MKNHVLEYCAALNKAFSEGRDIYQILDTQKEKLAGPRYKVYLRQGSPDHGYDRLDFEPVPLGLYNIAAHYERLWCTQETKDGIREALSAYHGKEWTSMVQKTDEIIRSIMLDSQAIKVEPLDPRILSQSNLEQKQYLAQICEDNPRIEQKAAFIMVPPSVVQ